MLERRFIRFDVLGAISAGLIVVAFCLVLLWRDPLFFWNDDYELSVLPVFADVARAWSEGCWPILSPYSWVCSNLAGEFQYGTFSVFINAAVVLIWKFPLEFAQQAAALSITHLFVLAAGAFLLARDRKLSTPLCVFLALVAALNGWIICWGAIDWFGALGAFTWLPWAWWGLERALGVASASSRWPEKDHRQDADATPSRWRFLWPALFVYLVVTGGFPYTVVMLVLLVAWMSARSLAQTRSVLSVWPMLFGAALGFGLSAPAWLALLDYVYDSARTAQPASAHWQWIVPPGAWPALILPCWTVKWADFGSHMMPHGGTELACGLVPPAALIAGLISRGRAFVRQIRWELLLLFLVCLLSMLPTAGVFRWSFRWLPFFHLVLAICAAEALRGIRSTGFQPMFTGKMPVLLQQPGVIAFGMIAITLAGMMIFRTDGLHAFPLGWIFLGLAGAWVCSELALHDSKLGAWTPAVITFMAFLATYLCIPANCGVPKYNLSPELTNPAPLDRDRLYLSVYPWAELTYRLENKPGPVGQTVRPGSTSMWAGLHFINGYSPILAAGAARQFKFTTHGEIDFGIGRYLLEQQTGPDGLLARLGVDGITIAWEAGSDPQPSAEWKLVATTEEGRVFHRSGRPFARVRSVTSIDARPDERFAAAMVSEINESREQVDLQVEVPGVDRPALLIFSRPFFRGYEAQLNDQKLVVGSYRGLFPTVEVPSGAHGKLGLVYRPWWLWGGGVMAILSAGIMVVSATLAVGRGGSPNRHGD